MSQDKRGSTRGGSRGDTQRGRPSYHPPPHNPPASGFNSGFRNKAPSPPPPYNPPQYNNPSNNPPPYNPQPYNPPPPQPLFSPQPSFPTQVYPSHQPIVNTPASSYITVQVSQIPPTQYPTQQPPQSHHQMPPTQYPTQQPPQSHHQMPPTQYPTQQPPQSHHQMPPAPGYYASERPQQTPVSYYQPDQRGSAHPNTDFNRPGLLGPHPSYDRHSDNQSYRGYPDNRDQPSRNDRDSYANSRANDHQQNQPHFRSHTGQSQNEPHYKKPDHQQNQPHKAKPSDPQNRSRPFNKGPQNKPSNFENERNPGKQQDDRSFHADKNATPPPSYYQPSPDRRKEGVYKGSDKKPEFSSEKKVPGESRNRSRERNPTNKSRLHSTDSTNSDRSETHRHYQGQGKYMDSRNAPASNRESDGLNRVQGNNRESKGKVNRAEISSQKPQATAADHNKDAARDDNMDQSFKGRMKGKAPFERRVSNASSVDSEQSTASELLGNVKDAGGERAKRSRHKGKKGMQNKDKFQSMPDLNSQETEGHVTDERKAANQAKGNSFKKPWNQKKNRPVKNPKKNDNEASKENPEAASIVRITKASIKIGIPFNDVASFKGTIIENIDLENNSSLEFDNDSIICSEVQGSGTFLVKASSKQLGKRLVKGLYANLRKNLKTNVEYNICGVEENKPVTGDNSAAKVKQNHKDLLKVDDFSRRSVRKKVTEILERSRMGDKKKKAMEQKADEVKADVLSGNAAESKARTTPAKVSVTINKIFPQKEDVFDLVLSIVEDKTSWIRLVPNSVAIAASKTLCEIEVLDKENAKKVIEKLHAFDFEGVQLRCFVGAVGLPRSHDDSGRTENIQEQIKKSIEKINKKTQQVLELHEKKIVELENALEIMNSSHYKEDNSDDFDEDNTYEQAALFDKLAEVTKQRDTFCSRRDQLIDSVNKLESVTTTADKSLSDLLEESVGVECERLKAALPIYARREDIVRQISENQVSVILGETGSGKSTQMAQYIYEAGLAGQGLIVCTQPRKVAAVTLAERVAKEMANSLGNLVGYKTGMRKNITKDKTKIVFATDHCLLNECLADPNLSQYTCIIVDEAHERSIYTDLLLGMIKACLTRRPDLKVVITSATIDPEIFIRYFRSGPELRVSGRTFPVEVVYSKPDDSPEFENFEMKAVTKAVDIHQNEDPGDILVFLTSPVEIMRCCEEFQKIMTGRSDFKCFPLHGQLPPDEQKQVFKQLPNGVRKIVFATNCAETSITIDGIKYVIDTGVAKEMRYDGKKNICTLGTFVISKSSADQRKGRAGRTASGKCYRLFSEEGYKNMEVSSQPEILRVPLGQSVLKLAELGVDVKMYDFVQAPSTEAIESALSSLRDLGALSSQGITDVGRWISKLPVSPKEGFLVYHGNQKGLLYDSVVLASLIANGSNLFYRGMTETDAQTSARSKSEFGSVYGDVFTWLEVYKAWNNIPPKEQSKWCQKNGINNKAINFTKQFVNDVVSVLKNELGVNLEKKFSSDESAPVTLRKILFEANVASVCHYLGHVRAGYYAVVAERQVHVHPSSTLLSNNSQPEWIVYTEFTKTSRDFIKGITAVEEDWVFEAAREGRLNVSINWVKQLKSGLVHRETVGSSVFRKLVGPRYSQLRVWEDELATAGMKAVVVEADNELGTIDIFSTSPMVQDTIDSFIRTKQEVIKTLKLEEAEISILKKHGTEPCGVRVLLGEGGCVKSLLLPDQSNTILVKKAAPSTTEEEIRAKFGVFGEIKECVRFKRADPWGFVRYSSFAEAQAAVDRTCKDEENCAVLKIDKQFKGMVNRFEARLSWCRRPIKGTGTAFIKCPPIEKASLIGKCISLPLGVCEIQVSRRGDELVCFKTGQAQEMDIKKAIMDLLDYDESLNQNIHVTLVREKVEPYSQRDINRIKDELANSFSQYVAKDKFSIILRQGKGNPVNQVAFIHFENPTNGFQACRLLKRELQVAGQSVEISPCLKTTLHVPEAIMKVCKGRFEEIFKGLEKFKVTNVNIRPLKQGDFAFDIKSEDVKSMVEARELLQRELEGETIDCAANNLLRKFLKQQGKEALKKMERLLDVLIVVNERREKVHIYGTEAKVNQTQIEINRYLGKLAEGKQVDVSLKGSDKPPGLMKELIRKYGSLHDELVQQFSLTDVDIDFRQQKLSIFGPVECVDNVVGSIAELAESLSQPGGSLVEKEMPDCVVCMTPVEQKSELYRLEACGHGYCLECLKLQITVSVQEKKFPIVCSEENCGMPLVWKDLNFCIRRKWTSDEKLMDKAVNAFVASNPEKYKFCLTPECPVIYAVTTNKEGCEFNCPSCFMSLCTSCHTAYHSGLTCHMSSIEEEVERQLKLWIREDPTNRKWCPKCRIGVEKTEGCNKMQCASCRTVFCWICLEIAVDSQKCYAHLMKQHGNIY